MAGILAARVILCEADGLRTGRPNRKHSDDCARATNTGTGAVAQALWHGPLEKIEGVARVRLIDGTIHTAEVHWYEAHGIGRKELKIKFPLLD